MIYSCYVKQRKVKKYLQNFKLINQQNLFFKNWNFSKIEFWSKFKNWNFSKIEFWSKYKNGNFSKIWILIKIQKLKPSSVGYYIKLFKKFYKKNWQKNEMIKKNGPKILKYIFQKKIWTKIIELIYFG